MHEYATRREGYAPPAVSEELYTRDEGPVRVVVLNRPEKRNALRISLRLELVQALREAGADPDVRAVVLAGEGPAFCGGLDKTEFGTRADDLYASTILIFETLQAYPKPMVAAVHGPAMGGGFYLSLASDLRVGGPETTFGTPEVTFGVPPSWGFLRSVLGESLARDVGLTGRPIGAEEAFRVGILNRLVDSTDAVRPAAVELAASIAAHPGPGVAMFRDLAARDRNRLTVPSLEDEIGMLRDALGIRPE
jgi:enoyl-CoA hydratase/carnithine racemase